MAGIIGQEIGNRAQTADLTLKDCSFTFYRFTPDDVCLIAIPVFAGRVPAIAVEHLRQISGGGARAIIVAVYGNRAYEDALIEMKDEAEACGFKVIAGIAALAEHSIMRQYAHGRPDASDTEVLKDFARKIRQKLESETDTTVEVPGNRPYKKGMSNGFWLPEADETCAGCGICAEQCPADAIDFSDLRHSIAEKCIGCMRCISVCPAHLRHLNPEMVNGFATKMAAAFAQRKENELFI